MHAIGLKSTKSHNGSQPITKNGSGASSSTVTNGSGSGSGSTSATSEDQVIPKRPHSLSATFKNLFIKPKPETALENDKIRQVSSINDNGNRPSVNTSSRQSSPPTSQPQTPAGPKRSISSSSNHKILKSPQPVAISPVSPNIQPLGSRSAGIDGIASKKPNLPTFTEEGSENSIQDPIPPTIRKPSDVYIPTLKDIGGGISRGRNEKITSPNSQPRSRSQSLAKIPQIIPSNHNINPNSSTNIGLNHQQNTIIGTIKLYENGQHEHILKSRKVLEKLPNSTGILSGFLKKSSTSIKNEVAFSLLPEQNRSDFQRRLSIQSSKLEESLNEFSSDEEHLAGSSSSESENESDDYDDDDDYDEANPTRSAAIGDAQLKLINRLVEKINNEEEPSLNFKNYKLSDKYGKPQGIIGKGAYGLVKLVSKIDSATKKEISYAVKELKKRDKEDSNQFSTRLTSEFVISNALDHLNIVKTLDLMKSSTGAYCEIMEYCSAGDLYTLILSTNGDGLHYIESDCFIKQILKGLSYMHSKGVAHCDIKPENILLTTSGVAKISDFGTSAVFRTAWEKECHFSSGACGSEPYVAPEEFVVKEYDPRFADVWSTGVVYLTMNTGGYVWEIAKNSDELYIDYLEQRPQKQEKFGKFKPIESMKSGEYYKSRKLTLYQMLDPNPKSRLTTKEVLNSLWMQNTNLCEAAKTGYH
ncbi:hypothetical protein BN7_6531 [Wickerhamomyces ciferrii]|uniref:Protein kinase domain-containing protein n=1 Tax=Wickerhamomyces ciferrii (strain ATCC 14091 / BCRC 22168 / CBS 111 / JCM 3599 / NBRC 0793 / NRRL Y-1031 F-60-10) TaxID=1206466 RepID=K0KNS4_WICCF|nr:uncharacterized protein BN7_6531 [Wickerhamomyces ciferrii]CCH46925.1 hypothetical protein BN7_6531 [Wickerhamomyces ciferrii]